MEVVGLAVGVAGLAGLFSTCIDSFRLVQRGRFLGRDYFILETKYTNQCLRLRTWGRACGFAGEIPADSPAWSDDVRDGVEETLRRITTLFQDHKTLSRRYGLSVASTVTSRSAVSNALGSLVPRLRATSLAVLGSTSRLAGKEHSIPAAARWAINDKDKFSELVKHLKDFVDDLEALTAEYDIPQRQRRFIQVEVESIYDVSELKTIEKARMDIPDPVADAASVRICQLQHAEAASSNLNRHADPSDHEWEEVLPAAGPVYASVKSYHHTLHRVSCDLRSTMLFLDAPTYEPETSDDSQWMVVESERLLRNPSGLHISGKRLVRDLDSFLKHNSQLWWLILLDYQCCHDTHRVRTVEPLQSSVRIISPFLCEELQSAFDSRNVSFITPNAELGPPYDWYYHNRQWLVYSQVRIHDFFPRWRSISKQTTGVATESQAVAVDFLQFIEDYMAKEYSAVKKKVRDCTDVTWEQLPLVFKTNELVVERCLDDDDFRVFQQVDRPSIAWTLDAQPHEVLKIPVRRHTNDLFCAEARHLEIPRSMFGNGPVSFKSLPIVPLNLAKDCNEGYLHNRGYKSAQLRSATFITYSEDKIPGVSDEYIVDTEMYKRLHYPADNSRPTERKEQRDYQYSDDSFYDDFDYPPYDDYDGYDECEPDYGDLDTSEYRRDRDAAISREYMCMPHAVHGFQLREHVWRKLLVRNIELVPPVPERDGESKGILIGSRTEEQLSQLLSPMRRRNWSPDNTAKNLGRVIISLQASGREAAAVLASRITHRPLYRIRLSDSIGSAEALLSQAKMLNMKWDCIVLIEDIIEARAKDADVILPLLHFLDSYFGIVIFFLPDEQVSQLHPEVLRRICMNFGQEDLDENRRREIWKKLIGQRSESFTANYDKPAVLPGSTAQNEMLEPDKAELLQKLSAEELEAHSLQQFFNDVDGIPPDPPGESRRMVDELSRAPLSAEEIRLIIDATLPPGSNKSKPNWALLLSLVSHRRSGFWGSKPTNTGLEQA